MIPIHSLALFNLEETDVSFMGQLHVPDCTRLQVDTGTSQTGTLRGLGFRQ